MPKYLIEASYTAAGLKTLAKNKAVGRKAAVAEAVKALGGKLEAFYYAFGKHDVIAIVEFPDNVSASSLSLTVSASGIAKTITTPLLAVEEVDRALQKTVKYQSA